MNEEAQNFLAHYGKLGMKWGHRSSNMSSDHAEVRQLRRRPASTMSDADLRKVINRINLEKQYKDINPKPPTRAYKQATKVVAGVLALGATANAVYTFVESKAGKNLITFIKSKVVK